MRNITRQFLGHVDGDLRLKQAMRTILPVEGSKRLNGLGSPIGMPPHERPRIAFGRGPGSESHRNSGSGIRNDM